MGRAKIFNETEFLYNDTSITGALFSVQLVQFINRLNKFSERLNVTYQLIKQVLIIRFS